MDSCCEKETIALLWWNEKVFSGKMHHLSFSSSNSSMFRSIATSVRLETKRSHPPLNDASLTSERRETETEMLREEEPMPVCEDGRTTAHKRNFTLFDLNSCAEGRTCMWLRLSALTNSTSKMCCILGPKVGCLPKYDEIHKLGG